MKKKTSKLYRFITEGADEDEKLDVVPGLEEEDEEKKDEEEVTEEDQENSDEDEVNEEENDVQSKAFNAVVDDKITEEDDSEEDKEEVTEEDEEKKDEEEVTEEDDSEEDKEEVTEEDELPSDDEELKEEGDSELDQKNPKGDIASKLSATQPKEDVTEEDEEEEELEEEESPEELQKKTDDEIEKLDVKEDVRALFSGKKLSKDFQKKVSTVFEAAVKKNVKKVVKKLQENYNSNLSKIEKKLSRKLVKDADKYLNYVAENWMKENELAIERGIRTEITEEFIRSFKTLCEQHNIDLPESKFKVASALAKKVEKLEKQLNETLNANIKLHKMLNEGKKERIVRQISKGLTATQAEKLAKLTEGITFKNSEQFTSSVKVLKESYFPTSTKTSKGEVLVEGGLKRLDTKTERTEVDVYADYLTQTLKS